MLNWIVCVELFNLLRRLLGHQKVLLDKLFHINETLDDNFESVCGVASVSVNLRRKVPLFLQRDLLKLHFGRLVAQFFLVVFENLATIDYFFVAKFAGMNVEVVPDKQLPVEAAEHDALLKNVSHVEQLGDLNVALLQPILVTGLIQLILSPVELIFYALLHYGPLVLVLLGVGDCLLHVKHHGHLANLKEVLDIFLQSLYCDLHVVARN